MGCYLAAQILGAVKTIETSEFRRAFIREYLPALPGLRDYLRRLGHLAATGRSTKYNPDSVPELRRFQIPRTAQSNHPG